MKTGRFIIGILIILLSGIYYVSNDLLTIDLPGMIAPLYGEYFATLIVPLIFIIVGVVCIVASFERKEVKRDFSQRVGKSCPGCGQVISELASTCPFCGKIQTR